MLLPGHVSCLRRRRGTCSLNLGTYINQLTYLSFLPYGGEEGRKKEEETKRLLLLWSINKSFGKAKSIDLIDLHPIPYLQGRQSLWIYQP